MGALQEYFRRAGLRAQHNANVLAAQRGLQPWDRVKSIQQIAQDRIPAPEMEPKGGGSSGADMGQTPAPMGLGYNRSLMDWRGEDEAPNPDTPQAREWERVKAALLGQNQLDAEPEAEPVEPANVNGMIFVEEPEGVAPQTSYSPHFGQSATFVPGTRIYGRDDPAKVREFNAMQAQQDDYDRRRRALEAAVAIPEGWQREMRAENPTALVEARIRAANAMAQGEQALGGRPSRLLPTDTARLGEVAKAQGQAEAQPYLNVKALQEMLGQAEISKRPEYAEDVVRRGEIGAGARMQPNQWSLDEVLHQRAVELAQARNAGLFGAAGQQTPAQAAALAQAQAEAEAGAQQVTPPEGEPSAGSGTYQGEGRVLTEAQLQRAALEAGVPVEVMRKRALASRYVIR